MATVRSGTVDEQCVFVCRLTFVALMRPRHLSPRQTSTVARPYGAIARTPRRGQNISAQARQCEHASVAVALGTGSIEFKALKGRHNQASSLCRPFRAIGVTIRAPGRHCAANAAALCPGLVYCCPCRGEERTRLKASEGTAWLPNRFSTQSEIPTDKQLPASLVNLTTPDFTAIR